MENKKNALSSVNANDIFIQNVEKFYQANENIHIKGKILHYIPETTIINFNIKITKTTEVNPFNSDILLNIEFVENNPPYICILNDFINPTLNDGRNLFYCLTNTNDCIFNENSLFECFSLIKEVVFNIKNFLICLKENIQINVFVFYGEYTIGKVYSINDFLLNYNNLKFYRILQINGKNQEMKYIIITQLYFLLFEPIETDKSYAKLILCNNLIESDFLISEFDYYQKKLNNKKGCLFKLTKDDIGMEIILIGENFKKCENGNEINEFKNELMKKKSEMKLDKYKLIIENYKPLFYFDSKRMNYKEINRISKKDYKLYIQYYEELYNYYKDLKEEKYQTRIQNFLSNIHFFCAEILSFSGLSEKETELYKSKVKKYINTC